MRTDSIQALKTRLAQPLPGYDAQNKMAARVKSMPREIPANAKESAVMALLFPKQEELNLLLIKRTEDGRAHSGQISFPGGRRDPEDNDLQTTAFRETFEEVGIASSSIELIGSLSSLYIPVSYSNVFPFVGFMNEAPSYNLSVGEVQYTIEIPVRDLFDERRKTVRDIVPSAFPDITIKAPAYELENNQILWGATAMMVSELETIIKELG